MASSVHINCHQGSAHQGAHAREGVYECVEGACMGVEGAGEGVESIRECVGSVHVGVEARRRGRGDVPAACADIYTPTLSSERRPEMPVAREARDLLPIQSLFRSIDFGPSSLPPFLLILSPTNGVTSSSVEHSLKRRK